MSAITRFACAALALLAAAPSARAQTTDCIDVKSVGYQINSPGVYCLKSPAAGTGILIDANDVVLDLNGYVVDASPNTTGPVIRANGRSGVTIRNGTVRGGRYGVSMSHDGASRVSGYLIERLRVERSANCGICVQGEGMVRNNLVSGVGASLFGARAGIFVSDGNGVRVSDNLVIDLVVNPGQVDGILAIDAPGAVIERNVVSNPVLPPSSGYPMGIHLYRSGAGTPMRTVVAGNRVVNMQTGISNHGDASLFIDNAVGGATTPFSGGVMAGTTNHSF
jgi:hypothetical protein